MGRCIVGNSGRTLYRFSRGLGDRSIFIRPYRRRNDRCLNRRSGELSLLPRYSQRKRYLENENAINSSCLKTEAIPFRIEVGAYRILGIERVSVFHPPARRRFVSSREVCVIARSAKTIYIRRGENGEKLEIFGKINWFHFLRALLWQQICANLQTGLIRISIRTLSFGMCDGVAWSIFGIAKLLFAGVCQIWRYLRFTSQFFTYRLSLISPVGISGRDIFQNLCLIICGVVWERRLVK